MLKNYVKFAWRNLLKDRQFTFLNLLGLSTGLACVILIYMWASDELSVDRFHKKNNLLFQVMQNVREENGIETIEATPGPLAGSLVKEMPEIAYSVPVVPSSYFSKGVLSVGDVHTKANGQFAGKDYFNIFSFPLIDGSKSQVLADKSSMVISRDLALRLFKTTDNVVGKSIRWQHENFDGHYLVSGVFENIPSNSSVQFDFLLNFDFYLEKSPELLSWGNSSPNTYVALKEHSNVDQFNQKIAGYMKIKSGDTARTLFARPYGDAYLFGKYQNGVVSGGRIEYVKLFSVIGIFILLIACINFMNLSTAAASRRVKEMAVKKTVGANRGMLVFQYLTESILMTFISLLFAVGLVLLILPQFNSITGKQLSFFHFDWRLILSVIGITFITGLLAGSYPALYLSGFNAVKVLKGKIKTSFSELLVRKGLVIFQFVISVVFIVAVLVVYKQTALVQSKNLGYNKDNIIYFEMDEMNEGFLAEAKNIPGVVNTSYIWGDFMGGLTTTSGVSWEGKNPNDMIDFGALNVGIDFIETFGMKMAAGRSFSRNYGSDSLNVILNETAIKVMGLKDPVGKSVKIWGQDLIIIGIVKDFHF